MSGVPFFDLKEQNRGLQKELNAAFQRITENADFILGGEVEKFEADFANFIGSRFAVGVNSGLDALSLALRVLGIGPGDEVILPANSFIATALAVTSVGAAPVFADAEPEYLLLDLAWVKKVMTKKTKAVIPVHLYGQPVDMKPLLDFCLENNLRVVEDACQAHGAAIGHKRCGSFGDLAAFSFYPGKNLGAFGDGGIVTTDDESLAKKLRLLRNYGSVVKYQHLVPGFNTRLDALQAAILNVKLPHVESWNQKRNELAEKYDARLEKFPQIQILKPRKGFSSVRHLYIARLDRRDALRDYLAAQGIGTSIHYPVPIHLQEAYAGSKNPPPLPVSEKEAKRVLSLPLYPEMPAGDIDKVCDAVGDFLGKK